MTSAISLTQTQIFTGLVAVLGTMGMVDGNASPIPIIRGQVNRVPEPNGTDFVVLWPVTRERMNMNVDTWQIVEAPTMVDAMQSTQVTIQADIHGPVSADNAAKLSTLFRDQFGVSSFQDQGFDLAPLYTSDPRQMPFDNGEQQVEERWTIDLTMQANVTISTAMQFADQLVTGFEIADIL